MGLRKWVWLLPHTLCWLNFFVCYFVFYKWGHVVWYVDFVGPEKHVLIGFEVLRWKIGVLMQWIYRFDLRVWLQADKRQSEQAIRRSFPETGSPSSHLKAQAQLWAQSRPQQLWAKWVIPFTLECNMLRKMLAVLCVPLLGGEISLKHGSGFAVVVWSHLQLLFSTCTAEVPRGLQWGLGYSWFGP